MLWCVPTEVNRGTMTNQPSKPDDQTSLWNGAGGRAWVASADLLDQLLQPMEDLLVAAVPSASRRVLDVGCGTGGTTVAIARKLGAQAQCTGADVSEPMIEGARDRAARAGSSADFVVGDAQTYAFDAGAFDALVSRFGVMFFKDAVAAFANLRRAAKPGAEMRFIVWRSPEENPFMTTAEHAAAPLLSLPARQPNEPGQFGLADRDHVLRILEQSGWRDGTLQPIDAPCVMPEPALARYVTQLGPVGRALQQADDELRSRVLATVLSAFAPFVHGAEVRFNAACWMIAARA